MRTYFLFICSLIAFKTSAQQVLSGASGAGAIGNVRINYTLGEMIAVHTAQAPGLIVTQGFHQPFRLLVSAEEPHLPADLLQIYPNPTALSLMLTCQAEANQSWQVRLVDNSGKLCSSQIWQLVSGQSQLVMSLEDQPTGVYYLHCVEESSGKSGVWKVIKTQP